MEPLEVFVFGGAVLLHDLGHTVTAYEGGYEAIRRTPEWRDAVLLRLDLADDDPTPPDEAIENPEEDIAKAALFDTLRALHAEQAEKLCEMSYEGPYDKINLLDDDELRPHLAQIIGRIAASHHWDRETLRHRLGGKLGGIGAAPDLGTIEPVKLACLLRCADACQIDQRRAPDIDYALHQPSGYSRQHWDAQNRLSLPFIDGDSIAFTSTRDFGEQDADAWWVAHDLVQVAHRELQECDALLRDHKLPSLAVTGVAGASDPCALAERARTSGWRPVDASLRVSDPRRMVELFGGEQYYGEGALWVALRELLQNGIDAIEARRVLEPGFEGRILVEQEAGEVDGKEGFWLHVSDDGVGMSERVLTRTLVDFGRSAKSGGELTQEFDGLKGKRVRTIGQYGIGFFSVLMLSEYVEVHSRHLGGGTDATKRLRFSWGSHSRPMLMSPELGALSLSLSTKVSIFIESNRFESLKTCLDRENKDLTKLVQMIAPLPNCCIQVCDRNGECRLARSPDMYRNENAFDWLASILPADQTEELLSKSAANLTTMLDQSGIAIGWATLNFADRSLFNHRGFRTEKGLCVQEPGSSGRIESQSIIGVLPCFDGGGPRRDRASKLRDPRFENWLSDQIKVLQPDRFTLWERDELAGNIYALGGDPFRFATIMVQCVVPVRDGDIWLAMDDFVDECFESDCDASPFDDIRNAQAREYLESKWDDILGDPYFVISNETMKENITMDGLIFCFPNIIGNCFGRREIKRLSYRIANIEDEFSFLGCLKRCCEQRSLSVTLQDVTNQFIGLSRDDDTGKLQEVLVDGVQIRIRTVN